MPKLKESRLIRRTSAVALILFTFGGAAAQELTTAPPDAAPPDSFPSQAPSVDAGARAEFLRSLSVLPLPRAAPMIGGGIWLAEGPGPAIFGQVEAITPGPGEVVGAVHALAAHPTDADILYLGGANGGLWKTTNATAASPIWTPLTDFETSLSIGALEFDPTDGTNKTLVAGNGRYSSFGSLGGLLPGLLRTTDGGATWAAIDGGVLGGTGISGVAPRGATIVASSNFSEPVFGCGTIGLFRSTDSGATFAQLSPFSVPPAPVGVAFDLAGDPAVPATLYTGMTFVDLVCSPASGFFNGIYKSTDTGLTWVKVSTAAVDAFIIDGTTNNIEIAVDGLDVYVNIIQSGRPAAIFHSGDGGTTWTPMDLPRTPEGAPLPIGFVVPSPACPGPPVVIDTTPTPHGFFGLAEEVELMGVLDPGGLPHPINGVWTTTVTSPFTFDLVGSCDTTPWMPGSGTWIKVVGLSPKEKAGSQGGIHASIRVDPTTPTTVYIGGDRQDSPFPNFLGALDFSGRLFRGDATVPPTGGAIPSPQWEHLTHLIGPPPVGGGTLSGSAPHADSREMVFDAGGDLIEGDDGGIYVRTSPSTNGGNWFSLNGNLQVTEIHDVAYDSISNVIISGNQDTGTTQQQAVGGNLTWDSISTADGGDVAVDDRTVPTISTRYSSFQNLGSFRRREYDMSNGLISEVFPTLTLLGGSPAPVFNFVTPVELNAIMPTSLVIGAFNDIYESFDKGDTINALLGIGVMSFGQNAIAYGGVKGGVPNPDVLWVGTGPVVQLRTGPFPAPLVATPTAFPSPMDVTDIVLDPTDWGTAYVSDATDIYMTHDSGVTWTAITGNLASPPSPPPGESRIGSLVIDPGGIFGPARLFAGGRQGVYELTLPTPGVVPGGPFVWGEIGFGLPNAPVWDMEWDVADGKLVVGTLGRGAWTFQENGGCGGGLIPDKLTVRNQWVATTQLDEACTQITAGAALDVTATGDLKFKSPTVVFLSGVSVKTGGKLVVENAAP